MALWDGYLRGGSVVIIGMPLAGDGIVGIEMKLCTKITYLTHFRDSSLPKLLIFC